MGLGIRKWGGRVFAGWRPCKGAPEMSLCWMQLSASQKAIDKWNKWWQGMGQPWGCRRWWRAGDNRGPRNWLMVEVEGKDRDSELRNSAWVCSAIVFPTDGVPLQTMRLQCSPRSTWEASWQGNNLDFFYVMSSVTNVCDISLPWLPSLAASKEVRPLRGSHSTRNDSRSLSSFSFDLTS